MGKQNQVTASWKSDLHFDGNVNGQIIPLNGKTTDNDGSASPKPLMLLALAGCTGMDVISILTKMRVVVEHFDVSVTGELSDNYPIEYISMHIVYKFTGKELPLEKIERAIELSQDKYCGVAALYKKAIPVTYEIRIVPLKS